MKNINTKIILMTTVLSAILLQSCSSLNEAAGKFNRAILDPISKKLDDACGNSLELLDCNCPHVLPIPSFVFYAFCHN
jgi:hypothetical protein